MSTPTQRAAHVASRVERTIHRWSAPRTPAAIAPVTSAPNAIVDVLFPSGLADDHSAIAEDLLADGVDHHRIRLLLGSVDQQRSPSPFYVRADPDDLVEHDVGPYRLLLDRADASVSRPILDHGVWEPHVDATLRRLLRPGDTFVDIGANVGYDTLLGADLVGPSGTVVAIEANSANAALIAATIARNHLDHAQLVPLALSDRVGFAWFRHAIGSNGGFVDAASSQAFPLGATVVPTVTLDALDLGRIHTIKIDIEGAEPLALAGAIRTIEEHRPNIVVEFSVEMTERINGVTAREHLTWIVERGYQLAVIDRTTAERLVVDSVDDLLAGWGDRLRIEDLLATPLARDEGR